MVNLGPQAPIWDFVQLAALFAYLYLDDVSGTLMSSQESQISLFFWILDSHSSKYVDGLGLLQFPLTVNFAPIVIINYDTGTQN